MSGEPQHHAPAGQNYKSIQDAGEQILAQYCDKYPQSPCRKSYILPVLFESIHPESIDQSTVGPSTAEQRRFTGLEINIRGERAEYEVYKVFYSLVRQSPTKCILVLYGYKLDNDNSRNLKKHAIKNELPCADLSRVNMNREHDMVVFVRYVGVVLCEVKSSASPQNMSSAESQLANSEEFVKQIMAAIAGQNSPIMPVVKIIIVPSEKSQPSPSAKMNDCHVVFGDILQNFSGKWSEVINELVLITAKQPINCTHFENLVQFSVGVWTMKPITKNTYNFDDTSTSLSSKISKIDVSIDQQQYAPTKQAMEFTTNIANSANEVFQRVDDMNIFYLTPTQKNIFDHIPQVLIHSHAGTGKSMLIIFKIIDLLEADNTERVLLVAPKPHHLRCKQIFEKHGISVDIMKKFRSRFVRQVQHFFTAYSVLIIAIEDFFQVSRSTLMSYNLSNLHVFVDDLHAHKVPNESSICTYSDIGNFIESTYTTLYTANKYFWIACDIVQGDVRHDDSYKPDQLFEQSNGSKRIFSIPLITLTKALRNTIEVAAVVYTARSEQLNNFGLNHNYVSKNIAFGHNITTGDRVLYEKLKQGTKIRHVEPFICERVCALLHSLSTISPQRPHQTFPFGTVAVLFADERLLVKYVPALQHTLGTSFNIGTQTIKEQVRRNNKRDLVVDHCGSIQSFECATVVYIREGHGGREVIYNAISRARTKCVVIDVDVFSSPLSLYDVDLVRWMVSCGSFVKV